MFDENNENIEMIQVLIVDDHGIIRDSLKRMLNTFDDMQVIGTASNGLEAFELIKNMRPDIVLMDAIMPICNGIEGTRLIKGYDDSIKVLMLTTFSDKELIYNAFDAGIDGYILKDITAEKLVKIIRDANQGELIIPTSIATILVKQIRNKDTLSHDSFNETEDEIIKLLLKGFSNKEIAQNLNISYGTTRNYISDIYKKVAETNRAQAIKKLRKYGENNN